MNDKSNLIVTGLSGMIGDRFRELYGHKYNFENFDITEGVDITDEKQVRERVANSEAEIILHLAAFTDVDAAEKQKDDKEGSCYKVNVTGTQNIVTAAKEHGKYVIFISTDFIFDGTKKKPYTEEDIPKPLNWYGQTKAWGEEIVRSQMDRNFSIIRISYPFRGNYAPKLDIVRKIIKGLKEDNLGPLFNDNFITPTFIDDLCKVFFMFTLKRPRGVFHATGSSFMSTYDLAVLIKQHFNLPGKVTASSLVEYMQTADRAYPKNLRMNNRKLQQELGNPMLTVESALQIMKTQVEL